LEFYEILSRQRKAIGMSFDELSAKSSVPVSTLKKLLTGVTRDPQLETVRAVTYALGLTLNDLDDKPNEVTPAERYMIYKLRTLDDFGRRAVRAVFDVELARMTASIPAPAPVISLRRYNEPAAAGVPLWAEDGYDYIDIPADQVPEGTDYAVGISGHSMEPDYPDGCTVFVRRCNRAHDGDVVIAWLDGEGTVCKRVVAPFGRVEILESINREYPDYTDKQLNGMRIYGKVIGYVM